MSAATHDTRHTLTPQRSFEEPIFGSRTTDILASSLTPSGSPLKQARPERVSLRGNTYYIFLAQQYPRHSMGHDPWRHNTEPGERKSLSLYI